MLQLYRVQDINLDDIELKNSYYESFLSGNIAKARRIIEKNPHLNQKILSADSLNKIVEAILYLEGLYYEEIEDVLDEQIFNYGISVDELIYMTNYNDTIQYEVNNFVMYEKNIYFCMIKPPIGTIPINDNYWLYLGLRGETSYPPLGVTYLGRWIPNRNYEKFDMVVFEDKIYVARTKNSNKNPSENPNIWLLAMTKYPQGIYVSCGGAQGTKRGDLWIYIDETFKLSKNGRIYINENEPMNLEIGDYWMQLDRFYKNESYGIYISKNKPNPSELPENTIWVKIEGFDLQKTSLYIAPYYPSIFKDGSIWIELLKE